MITQSKEQAIELLKAIIAELESDASNSVVLYYNGEAAQLIPQPTHHLRTVTLSWSVEKEEQP